MAGLLWEMSVIDECLLDVEYATRRKEYEARAKKIAAESLRAKERRNLRWLMTFYLACLDAYLLAMLWRYL